MTGRVSAAVQQALELIRRSAFGVAAVTMPPTLWISGKTLQLNIRCHFDKSV
jgi:hypothetical protein